MKSDSPSTTRTLPQMLATTGNRSLTARLAAKATKGLEREAEQLIAEVGGLLDGPDSAGAQIVRVIIKRLGGGDPAALENIGRDDPRLKRLRKADFGRAHNSTVHRAALVAMEFHHFSNEGRALPWSHQTLLAGINDRRLRQEIEARAVREKMSAHDLDELIKKSKGAANTGRPRNPIVKEVHARLLAALKQAPDGFAQDHLGNDLDKAESLISELEEIRDWAENYISDARAALMQALGEREPEGQFAKPPVAAPAGSDDDVLPDKDEIDLDDDSESAEAGDEDEDDVDHVSRLTDFNDDSDED